jgi:hypothetical protein
MSAPTSRVGAFVIAGIEGAAAFAHDEPVHRGKAHRGGDPAPGAHGAQAGAVARCATTTRWSGPMPLSPTCNRRHIHTTARESL